MDKLRGVWEGKIEATQRERDETVSSLNVVVSRLEVERSSIRSLVGLTLRLARRKAGRAIRRIDRRKDER